MSADPTQVAALIAEIENLRILYHAKCKENFGNEARLGLLEAERAALAAKLEMNERQIAEDRKEYHALVLDHAEGESLILKLAATVERVAAVAADLDTCAAYAQRTAIADAGSSSGIHAESAAMTYRDNARAIRAALHREP